MKHTEDLRNGQEVKVWSEESEGINIATKIKVIKVQEVKKKSN